GQHQTRKESAVIQLGGVVGDTDVVAPQGDGRITRSQAVMHVVEVPDQLGVLPLLRGDGGALGLVGSWALVGGPEVVVGHRHRRSYLFSPCLRRSVEFIPLWLP